MQTSIEWLENKVKLMIEHNGCEDLLAVLEHIEQAKEIHKKEIIDSYNQGYRDGENDSFYSVTNKKDISEYSNADNYYNQTYKNEHTS